MTPIRYLGLAFALIWIILALYLLFLGRRAARLRGELLEIRRRLDKHENGVGG